jgi:DNA adenine methylase
MASKIVAFLPPHETYVEPFGGAASVLFAKEPSAVEVYNDVHSGVVNLFRVLRDPSNRERFLELAALTLHSREEFGANRVSWESEPDPVMRAYLFYVTAKQSFSGIVSNDRLPSWSYSVSNRSGSGCVNAFLSAVDHLPQICDRLRRVTIEHDDWRKILTRFDRPSTVFYCDPPYTLDTRFDDTRGNTYLHEFTTADHADLLAAMCDLRGMVVLSGYSNPLYNDALESRGWTRTDFIRHLNAAPSNSGKTRTESVWLNPAAIEARKAA